MFSGDCVKQQINAKLQNRSYPRTTITLFLATPDGLYSKQCTSISTINKIFKVYNLVITIQKKSLILWRSLHLSNAITKGWTSSSPTDLTTTDTQLVTTTATQQLNYFPVRYPSSFQNLTKICHKKIRHWSFWNRIANLSQKQINLVHLVLIFAGYQFSAWPVSTYSKYVCCTCACLWYGHWKSKRPMKKKQANL